MSPARADAPLRKVTLNLYEDDCAYAEKTLGHGWTEELRQAWHDYLRDRLRFAKLTRTLGDLE